MNHPEVCTSPLPFSPNDPYAISVYDTILTALLEAGPDDTDLAQRVQKQKELARPILGDRLAELVMMQAIIDDLDIRVPQPELLS